MGDIGTGTNCFSKSLSALGFFWGTFVCMIYFHHVTVFFSGSLNLRFFVVVVGLFVLDRSRVH